MSDHMSVNLAVSSPVVSEALREGASAIQLEEMDRENSAEGVVGFSRERRKRRIALATALDEQLEEGRAVVDVPGIPAGPMPCVGSGGRATRGSWRGCHTRSCRTNVVNHCGTDRETPTDSWAEHIL